MIVKAENFDAEKREKLMDRLGVMEETGTIGPDETPDEVEFLEEQEAEHRGS